MKKRITAVALASVWALSLTGGASAHRLIVTAPGHDEPVVDQPVSTSFAQAHCHAQSPAVLSETPSAAEFAPAAALPCPAVENPGGQLTGP